jgi:SOS response regulatory protein OraA/RecX
MVSFLHQKGYALDLVQSYVIHHEDVLKSFIDEDKELTFEIQKWNKKLDKTELTEFEKSQKLIAHLMSKGYPYQEIKKVLERGTIDER